MFRSSPATLLPKPFARPTFLKTMAFFPVTEGDLCSPPWLRDCRRLLQLFWEVSALTPGFVPCCDR